MTTIGIKPEIKAGMEEILNRVSSWEAPDLERLLHQMGSLLARKKTSHLSKRETELLLQINEPVPLSVRERYSELHEKLQDENISKEEHKELLQLVEHMEVRNVKWLKALIELSRLRGVSLSELKKQLGLNRQQDG